VPYKYDLTKFVNVGSISVDHIDPSIFCVLTAKSRDVYAPLTDLLIFSPRWDVASRKFDLIRPLLHYTKADGLWLDKTPIALRTITETQRPN
jgi:homogentisate 1,2-dioxygenase